MSRLKKYPKARFKNEERVLFPLSKSSAVVRPGRVVVTGAGIVTALGLGWKVNARGFRAGRSAFRPVTLFDVSRQRAKIAAEIDLPSELPQTGLSTNTLRRLDRATRMLLHATHEAWMQAGWNSDGRFASGSSAQPAVKCHWEKNICNKPLHCHHEKSGRRRVWCTIKSSSKDLICAMPSAFKARSFPFPMPAPRAPMPSVMPGKCCEVSAPKGYWPAATTCCVN